MPGRPQLDTRLWTVEEFAAARELWDELLGQSEADPLFMSWDWQWRWWAHHAPVLGATLRLVAVYDGARLVGLAPFYSRVVRVRKLFRRCRLELIGVVWRGAEGAFSDYLDLLALPTHREAVLAAVGDWLARHSFWDEMALCCTKRTGLAAQLAERHLCRDAFVREVDPADAWCVALPERFEHYVEALSSGTRRKLFNHRARLVEPVVEEASAADVTEYLNTLWQFSAERWGGEAGNTKSPAFHLDVARAMARQGRLRLSRLRSDGQVLSIMYNIRAGETVYYLQSGFDAAAANGLSPGYLHFGHAIEAACHENAGRFDFLAGRGRHRNYKRDLLTECVPVVTYHVVRGAISRRMQAAYAAASRYRIAFRGQ